MFNLGWPEILIILLVVVLLFGRGKISGMMGDVAKGIKSFRAGMSETEDAPATGGKEARKLSQDASLTLTPQKEGTAKS